MKNQNNPSVCEVLTKGYLVGRSANEINSVISAANQYRINRYLDTRKRDTAVRSLWSIVAGIDKLLKSGKAHFENSSLKVDFNLI